MEVVLVLLALGFVLLPIIAIVVATSRTSALGRELERLEKELAVMRARIREISDRQPPPASEARPSPIPSERRQTPPVVAETIDQGIESASTTDEPWEFADPDEAALFAAKAPTEGRPAEELAAPHATGTAGATGRVDAGAQPPRPDMRRPERRRPERPRREKRTNQEWEALVGGKLLNRIGAIALIIGIGFFLKYAFDNDWITETMRVAIGGATGLTLIGLGLHFTRKDYQVFAQGLFGAGIAALYLSVYASFNFYHLVGQLPAFALMSAVTVIAFWLATRYKSIAIALLGLAGGFVTPLLLSTGSANQIGLFTYLAILDAGLLALAARRPDWIVIEPLALVGTTVYFVGWWIGHYTPAAFTPTLLFTGIFWAIFFGANIVRGRTGDDNIDITREGVTSVATILLWGSLFTLAPGDSHTRAALLLAAAGIVAAAILAARIFIRRGWTVLEPIALVGAWVVYFAVCFDRTKLGDPVHIDAAVSLLFVAFYGLLFIVADVIAIARERERYPGAAHITALLNAAFLWHALAFGFMGEWPPYLTGIGTLAIGAAHAVALRLSERHLGTKPVVVSRFIVIACTMLALAIWQLLHEWSHESAVDDSRRIAEHVTMILWSFQALAVTWYGLRRRLPIVWGGGLVLFGAVVEQLAATGSLGTDPEGWLPVLNLRVLTLAVLAVTLAAAARLHTLHTGERKGHGTIAMALHHIWPVVLFILVTLEPYYHFHGLIESARAVAPPAGMPEFGNINEIIAAVSVHRFHRDLTFAAVWLLFSLPLIVLGLRRRLLPLLRIGMATLGLSILWGTIAGFGFRPIIEFTPLMNGRAATLILIAIGAYAASSLFARHAADANWIPTARSVLRIALVLLVLDIASIEAWDWFERAKAVIEANPHMAPVTATRVLDNQQQLVLSGIWLLYSMGLMAFGIWRRTRPFRIMAFFFFGFTILKIFAYDLSFLATLYRIFSFIGLGLILLTVSWLYQRYKDAIFGDGEPAPEGSGTEESGAEETAGTTPEDPPATS